MDTRVREIISTIACRKHLAHKGEPCFLLPTRRGDGFAICGNRAQMAVFRDGFVITTNVKKDIR